MAGEPAKADGDMYGEPVSPSGGPRGSTCHQDCPAAASQSTNLYACSSSTPFGNEVGCSRIPDARSSSMGFQDDPTTDNLTQCLFPRLPNHASRSRRSSRSSTAAGTRSSARSARSSRSYATVFKDGHDLLGGAVRVRGPGESRWREEPLAPLGNDRWGGTFTVDRPGRWQFAVAAWTDRNATWQDEKRRKDEAAQTDRRRARRGRALLGRAR